MKGGFLCHVLVYKGVTRSAFYRQQAIGEHSWLPAIFLFIFSLYYNYIKQHTHTIIILELQHIKRWGQSATSRHQSCRL